ncbi:MAG: phage holin family protein [Alphaproteobacteria bacterium]|nr:phage holin family protein [Alphaproteobacteria bacterium]
MRGFFIRWGIHAASLWVAALVVPGISFPGDPPGVVQVLMVALIFGLVNAFVRPVLALASCGFYVLTLGLFHFVVNALMLLLTAWLAGPWLDVDGFFAAFVGALVVSVIGSVLTWVLDPPDRDDAQGIVGRD